MCIRCERVHVVPGVIIESTSTQRAASVVSFSVGEHFRAFGELEDKLKWYEESTFTNFGKRLQNSESRQETYGQTSCWWYQVLWGHLKLHSWGKFKARGEGKRATMQVHIQICSVVSECSLLHIQGVILPWSEYIGELNATTWVYVWCLGGGDRWGISHVCRIATISGVNCWCIDSLFSDSGPFGRTALLSLHCGPQMMVKH